MKRHEDLIDREAYAYNIKESRELQKDVKEILKWREESLARIALEVKEQSAKEFDAIRSWLRVNESDQLTIFESVASQGNNYPGTCEWVLKDAKIRSWMQRTPQNPILWISGTAGSGKSVISTQIINFMKSSPAMTVLCHFCGSPLSSEYDQVIKSLLEQLVRQDGDLAAYIYYEYVLKKQLPSVPNLEILLQNLLIYLGEEPNQPSYIWIVLDGMDELCDHSPNFQARLLSSMKQIVSKTSAAGNSVCKILFSTRPSTTFNHALRRRTSLSLTEEKKHLGVAIQQYAWQRLRTLQARFQQLGLDASEVEEIGLQISKKADGEYMIILLCFQWLALCDIS